MSCGKNWVVVGAGVGIFQMHNDEWAMDNKGGMPMPVDICPGAMEPIWDWAGTYVTYFMEFSPKKIMLFLLRLNSPALLTDT